MRKETVGWEINKRLYLPTALSKSACVPHTQTNVLSGSSAHVMGLSDFKPDDETKELFLRQNIDKFLSTFS